jgi:hypothetical protein
MHQSHPRRKYLVKHLEYRRVSRVTFWTILSPQTATDCTRRIPVFKSRRASNQTPQNIVFAIAPNFCWAAFDGLRQWSRRISGCLYRGSGNHTAELRVDSRAESRAHSCPEPRSDSCPEPRSGSCPEPRSGPPCAAGKP